MKFTVKGLIALFVTSSALFLTPMKSDAQVNMKRLAQVAKSCQKDVSSFDYYKQMGFDSTSQINYLLNDNNEQNISGCIQSRYHYSLILDKFPELASTGEILPGYPGSVAVGQLAKLFNDDNYYGKGGRVRLLDCIIANDTSSSICQGSLSILDSHQGRDSKYKDYTNLVQHYLPYVCPSCVVAHDEVSGSQEAILKAFIERFLKLDKPQRREVISLLGDEDEAIQLRRSLDNESEKAVEEYRETRARVQQQEQERRKRELLGN